MCKRNTCAGVDDIDTLCHVALKFALMLMRFDHFISITASDERLRLPLSASCLVV